MAQPSEQTQRLSAVIEWVEVPLLPLVLWLPKMFHRSPSSWAFQPELVGGCALAASPSPTVLRFQSA
jgi:hypothetical protein